MVQFQLEFQNLVLEDIKEQNNEPCPPPAHHSRQSLRTKSETDDDDMEDEAGNPLVQIAMAWDKGSIPHPHPDLASQHVTVLMKGAFILPLPLGLYPKLPCHDQAKCDKLLKQMALEQYSLDHETAQELALYPTSEVFQIAPVLSPWDKTTDTFLKVVFTCWTMDDFFSRTLASNLTPLLTKEDFTDFEKFLVNIMTGLYQNTDAIPNTGISCLNKILKSWFDIFTELQKHVELYEMYRDDFLKELLNWVRFYKLCALHMGYNWKPENQPYASLKYLGGRKVVLEFIQLVTSTYLDDSVRQNVIFKLFIESADLIVNMVYDVVNLTRAGGVGTKICRNALLKKIMVNAMPFETVMEQHLRTVNNEILDLQKISKALIQEFPNVEAVEKYVNNTLYFVDGLIRYFLSQERYGKCDSRIMRVVKISQDEGTEE